MSESEFQSRRRRVACLYMYPNLDTSAIPIRQGFRHCSGGKTWKRNPQTLGQSGLGQPSSQWCSQERERKEAKYRVSLFWRTNMKE